MSRSPSDRTLNDLADEFEVYRHSNGFNEFSLVIDNSDREWRTPHHAAVVRVATLRALLPDAPAGVVPRITLLDLLK